MECVWPQPHEVVPPDSVDWARVFDEKPSEMEAQAIEIAGALGLASPQREAAAGRSDEKGAEAEAAAGSSIHDPVTGGVEGGAGLAVDINVDVNEGADQGGEGGEAPAVGGPRYEDGVRLMTPEDFFACVDCQRSKTKCDKGNPCERCVAKGGKCVMQPKFAVDGPWRLVPAPPQTTERPAQAPKGGKAVPTTFRACKQCRQSKIRCTKGKTCVRCTKRGLKCKREPVMEEDAYEQPGEEDEEDYEGEDDDDDAHNEEEERGEKEKVEGPADVPPTQPDASIDLQPPSPSHSRGTKRKSEEEPEPEERGRGVVDTHTTAAAATAGAACADWQPRHNPRPRHADLTITLPSSALSPPRSPACPLVPSPTLPPLPLPPNAYYYPPLHYGRSSPIFPFPSST